MILGLIIFNAVPLGMEVSLPADDPRHILVSSLSNTLLTVFAAEILLRVTVTGKRFFSSAWHIFDFVVVVLALAPVMHQLTVLRAMRILQAFRLFSTVPSVRMVIDGTLKASTGLAACLEMVLLIYYIYAVMTVHMFADAEHFGDLWKALASLYLLMTSKGTNTNVMQAVAKEIPLAWWIISSFMLITSFAVINLIISVFSAAVNEQYADTRHQAHTERADEDLRMLLEGQRAIEEKIGNELGMLIQKIAVLELLVLEGRQQKADPATED
ncbi:MAG: ion transporter [Candidatus Protistobacter heckmanni]|nr:ion transporter [Candidatus Protistobacter heckmanni]